MALPVPALRTIAVVYFQEKGTLIPDLALAKRTP
jgi:hypothetical protein